MKLPHQYFANPSAETFAVVDESLSSAEGRFRHYFQLGCMVENLMPGGGDLNATWGSGSSSGFGAEVTSER